MYVHINEVTDAMFALISEFPLLGFKDWKKYMCLWRTVFLCSLQRTVERRYSHFYFLNISLIASRQSHENQCTLKLFLLENKWGRKLKGKHWFWHHQKTPRSLGSEVLRSPSAAYCIISDSCSQYHLWTKDETDYLSIKYLAQYRGSIYVINTWKVPSLSPVSKYNFFSKYI